MGNVIDYMTTVARPSENILITEPGESFDRETGNSLQLRIVVAFQAPVLFGRISNSLRGI
ncbi:hypothetical protein ACPUD8_19435 [Brevibacterium sp. FAM 25378]|uniref:hypothetical protein n=1 Tax=unclassified Brevibacterium TaxID=2614124 RepID=UPI00143D3C99|nr:hypothetical protein [Brevibacterium sp. S22]